MPVSYFISAILILTFIGVIAILIWMAIRKNRKHPLEEGKQPLFSANVSGVIGWVRFRGPMIRVVVYDEFLLVSSGKHLVFPFADGVELQPCSFLFSKGYRIQHQNAHYPKRVEFWLKDREGFIAATGGKARVLN